MSVGAGMKALPSVPAEALAFVASWDAHPDVQLPLLLLR
jgi:hypothetical protein